MDKAFGSVGTWAILLALVLTSSVIGAVLSKLMERSAAYLEHVQEGYAEATKALVAWDQFPYRIRRRVNDEPEIRRGLAELGSDIQERLGYSLGWVSAESAVMGEFYAALMRRLRIDVGEHARFAWQSPPSMSPAGMNLGYEPAVYLPAGWAYVQMFSAGFRYRFGWRRYLIPSAALRRILVRRGLWPASGGSAVFASANSLEPLPTQERIPEKDGSAPEPDALRP